MAELNFSLPTFSEVDDAEERQKIKSYLFQLTEQLRYVLNNLDEDNMAVTYVTETKKARTIAESAENLAYALENNLATDYKDLFDKIVEQATEITQAFESRVEQTERSIVSTVSENYAAKSELAEVESNFQSSLSQTSQAIELSVSEVSNYAVATQKSLGELEDNVSNTVAGLQSDIAGNATAIDEFRNEVTTYFQFAQDGLTIGQSTSEFKTKLDNQSLQFLQNDTPVAYISNETLHITNAEVVYRLSIGNTAKGYFDFVPRANGNVSMVWRDPEEE